MGDMLVWPVSRYDFCSKALKMQAKTQVASRLFKQKFG